jgi:hypothetical protein
MTNAAKLAIDKSDYESENASQHESENENSSETPDEPTEEAPNRLSENDAVAECLRAWHITMENERAKLDEDEDERDAEKEANEAFLAAMPPLAGHRNICDFIACVTQAYMWDIIRHQQAEHLFAAAKIALSALRLEPEPAGATRRGPGRPRKSPANEKIN